MTILTFLLLSLPAALGGFGDPGKARQVVQNMYGRPCDCAGGRKLIPGALTIRTVDCGPHVAHLQLPRTEARPSWICKQKPQQNPTKISTEGQCPVSCVPLRAVHSLCYREYTECLINGKVHLMATLTDNSKRGSIGGDWEINPRRFLDKYHMLEEAGCEANKGETVCWPKRAPILISDGGGPTDKEKEN